MEKEQVIKYYITENHSMGDTALFFGVKKGKMERFCHDNGISKEGKKARFCRISPNKEDLVKMYIAEKKTMGEIADIIGCSSRTVPIILQRNGIPLSSVKQRIEKAKKTNLKKYGC